MWTSLRGKLLVAIMLGRFSQILTVKIQEQDLLASGRGRRLIFCKIQVEISPYQKSVLKQKNFTRALSQLEEVHPTLLSDSCFCFT